MSSSQQQHTRRPAELHTEQATLAVEKFNAHVARIHQIGVSATAGVLEKISLVSVRFDSAAASP